MEVVAWHFITYLYLENVSNATILCKLVALDFPHYLLVLYELLHMEIQSMTKSSLLNPQPIRGAEYSQSQQHKSALLVFLYLLDPFANTYNL